MEKLTMFRGSVFYEMGMACDSVEERVELRQAIMEYGLFGKEPPEKFKVLFVNVRFILERSKEISEERSKAGKNHTGNQYSKGDKKRKSKAKAQKNTVEQMEQMEQNGTNGTNQTSYSMYTYTIPNSKEEKNKKKEEGYSFDDFWRDYPHARKGIKHKSEDYFKLCDPNEVKKQVRILKRKIKAGLTDVTFVPACERRIRDFTPLNEDVVKQDLIGICKRHLEAGGDMKQRSHELKETFGEQQINEIVKAIQQKEKPHFISRN